MVFLAFAWFGWFCLVLFGFPRFCLVFVWFCFVLFGFFDLLGFAMFFLVLLGFACCLVLLGFGWF